MKITVLLNYFPPVYYNTDNIFNPTTISAKDYSANNGHLHKKEERKKKEKKGKNSLRVGGLWMERTVAQ